MPDVDVERAVSIVRTLSRAALVGVDRACDFLLETQPTDPRLIALKAACVVRIALRRRR